MIFSLADIALNAALFLTLYSQVFLLFTFLQKYFRKAELPSLAPSPSPAKTFPVFPSVAVIVPCWNEEKTLAGTVRSLLALDYPKDKLQILVVDDGSTDRTLAVAQEFKNNPQIKIFTKKNGGKHTALNFGIAHSESDLVGCLDADAFVEKNALLEVVRNFREHPEAMAVTPAIRVFEPKNILQKIQRVEYNMGIFLRKMFSEMNAITVTPGPFSIFRREVFADLGEYKKAHNTEDMEYALRMHKNFYPIGNANGAFVHTVTPATLRALIRQRLRWVYGFLRNAHDYRVMIFNKKYGNVGMFSMPMAVLSILTVLYFTTLAVFHAAGEISEAILRYRTVGFHFPDISLTTSAMRDWWFFWNTNPANVLLPALLFCGAAIIFLGQKMAEGEIKIHSGILYFFLFYGLLAPIWIFRAVFNVAFAKKSSWR